MCVCSCWFDDYRWSALAASQMSENGFGFGFRFASRLLIPHTHTLSPVERARATTGGGGVVAAAAAAMTTIRIRNVRLVFLRTPDNEYYTHSDSSSSGAAEWDL